MLSQLGMTKHAVGWDGEPNLSIHYGPLHLTPLAWRANDGVGQVDLSTCRTYIF